MSKSSSRYLLLKTVHKQFVVTRTLMLRVIFSDILKIKTSSFFGLPFVNKKMMPYILYYHERVSLNIKKIKVAVKIESEFFSMRIARASSDVSRSALTCPVYRGFVPYRF